MIKEMEMLTESQFRVLQCIARSGFSSQRELAAAAGVSLGAVNAALGELTEADFVDGGGAVTEAGIAALEPYRVENAVIMAAGMSSRFAPISCEKPKGVLTVRGEVLIERQIRQLREAGIDDITVVVGYKKEEFFYLEDMFGVRIVVNPDYATRNNNSTIRRVAHLLGNTYICSSDDYFTESPFEKYVYRAYYATVFEEGPTAEYCVIEKGRDRLIAGATVGGSDAWTMMGHVYWDREFSARFLEVLDRVYDLPETAGKLWEDIYIDHIDGLSMVSRHYPAGVIWEFDSLDELRVFDPDFLDNIDSDIMDNICSVLGCARADICGIAPIKQGLTNLSFRFEVNGEKYVYRHPGAGTEEIIDRRSEAFSQEVAKRLGLDDTYVHEDPEEGWKISRFIENCTTLDYRNPAHVKQAMAMARTLHGCSVESDFSFDLLENALKMIDALSAEHRTTFADFDTLFAMAAELDALAKAHGARICLCHNDFYDPNFLVSEDGMQLIDWEYSGMADYASDLGVFICCCGDYTYDDAVCVLEEYFQRPLTDEELPHCISYVSLASFYWFIWALYKDMCGNPVGEYLLLWYRYAKQYGKRALELKSEMGL